ncbi:HypC/HybG/HupF family hydrogenase formation chaperone [Thalassoroseus pseudoceratinae]|uniref:HypC/HybG/HupF family hydrogenase formation chaperone n=1 Tax=Thalassoroseus pseudoceratinae TaxID=2713176 RepID=UPI0014213B3E|nr:HypC/HybG/HupF family hydrogenase formation chaperone [Thalassoroseus pseudoceratinae]
MCLGIPGLVIELYTEHDVLMGRVDFDGVRKEVCLAYLPEVSVGNYVIVHVGFALSIVDETEAQEVFKFLDQMSELDELDGMQP